MLVNKELQLVDQWLIANRLSVNGFKTKYVLFKTAQSKLTTKKQTLTLRQNKIEQVECIKFLGVYIPRTRALIMVKTYKSLNI